MSTVSILKIAIVIMALYFSYMGVNMLFSKSYYVNKFELEKEGSFEDAIKKIPTSRILIGRVLGLMYLILGLGFLGLFMHSQLV